MTQRKWLALTVCMNLAGCTDDGSGESNTTTGGENSNTDATNGNDNMGDDDGGTPAGSNTGNPVGNGDCSKGAYGNSGVVAFCSPALAAMPAMQCMPVENLRGYTSIGDVDVSGVSDLSMLTCLKTAGQLTIARSDLTDLKGLENLEKVASIVLLDDAKLKSLEGLSSLTSANGLQIINTGMVDLEGLSNPLALNNLIVERNTALTSLAGLEDVTVTTFIGLAKNPMLSQCDVDAFAARFPKAKLVTNGNLEGSACE